MKKKLFDRILLALLLIFTVVLALGLMVFGGRVIPLQNIQETIADIYGQTQVTLIIICVAVVLLLIALRLTFANTSKKQPNATLVKATELGGTFISLEALNVMIQKHCKSCSRIRNSISSVIAVKDGIVIRLRLFLMPETDIPQLTQELQRTLKEYIEKYSGVYVQQVSILVEDTAIDLQARVS